MIPNTSTEHCSICKEEMSVVRNAAYNKLWDFVCTDCHEKTGAVAGPAEECGTCNGAGDLWDDLMERDETCPDCKGTGRA